MPSLMTDLTMLSFPLPPEAPISLMRSTSPTVICEAYTSLRSSSRRMGSSLSVTSTNSVLEPVLPAASVTL